MNSSVIKITKLSIVCAMYIVLTIINPFSYDTIQFRISEILMLLVFFDKKYSISLIIGCFISNLFSSLMLYDIIFGTLATAIACIGMICVKNIYVSILFPIISNGLLVPLELTLAFKTPFLINVLWVVIGETVVMIIGVIIFSILKKRKFFIELINLN